MLLQECLSYSKRADNKLSTNPLKQELVVGLISLPDDGNQRSTNYNGSNLTTYHT